MMTKQENQQLKFEHKLTNAHILYIGGPCEDLGEARKHGH